MRPAFWISLFVAACGLSASSQTVPTINACVNNLNGIPRLVASAANCIAGIETFKQWNTTGPQGPQGFTGPQGPQGFTGSQGQQGLTGAQGLRGLTGIQGPIGPAGIQGPIGPAGIQGVAGPTGSAGADGLKGDTGAQGAAGKPGAAGTPGAIGPEGPRGPSGPTGSTGLQGPTGGQVWSASTTLPAGITDFNYVISPSGVSDTVGFVDFLSRALPVPVSCTAGNFTVTMVGAVGAVGADAMSATLISFASDLSAGATIGPSCVVTPNGGPSASCSSSTTTSFKGGDFIFLDLVSGGQTSSSEHVYVSFTCQ
jgi:hypothetical protein